MKNKISATLDFKGIRGYHIVSQEDGEHYEDLNWLDPVAAGMPKPTEEQLETWYQEMVAALAAARLPDALAAYRYAKEQGGVVIGGNPFPTDDRMKVLLSGAVNSALLEDQPTRQRSFKVGGAFITVTNEQVLGIGAAIAAHVQKCFDAEAAVTAQIQNGSVTEPEDIPAAFDAAYASLQ